MRVSHSLLGILVLLWLLLSTRESFAAQRQHSLTALKEKLPDAVAVLGTEKFEAVSSLIESQLRTIDVTITCHCRLTLTSGTPVTSTDVPNATTVYLTPFNGNKISLYSGTQWRSHTFSQTSVAVPSTTTTNFDIFGYNNSGTLALETVNWTNATTRATALTLQNGVYVKNGDTTRRYLGSARTTGTSGQTEDSATKRFLWNMHNRVFRTLILTDAADHSYSTVGFRQYGGSTSNQVEALAGLAGEPIFINTGGLGLNTASAALFRVGIGIDSTTGVNSVPAGDIPYANVNHYRDGFYAGLLALGWHYYSLNQNANTAGTSWFDGIIRGWTRN